MGFLFLPPERRDYGPTVQADARSIRRATATSPTAMGRAAALKREARTSEGPQRDAGHGYDGRTTVRSSTTKAEDTDADDKLDARVGPTPENHEHGTKTGRTHTPEGDAEE